MAESKGSTLEKNLIHKGEHLPKGSPVPKDLTDAEKDRLKRLGVIK